MSSVTNHLYPPDSACQVKPGRNVKIAITVSNRWTDYLQYMRFPYDFALYRAGAKVVTIAPRNIKKIAKLLDQVDGVVFSGGEDIGSNKLCDEMGFKVMSEAVKRKMPILGICRGMQLLALANGGSLITHDENPELFRRHKAGLPAIAGHDVNINSDSRLFEIFGHERIHVNSIHHQSVNDPGNLIVSGKSSDGMIEAVESGGSEFLLGVQWHPELRAIFNSENEKIFKTLVDEAVKRKASSLEFMGMVVPE